jgi:hypothetical protein
MTTSRQPRCEAALSTARADARKRKGWTDRACVVLDNGTDHYTVQDEQDSFVWEGTAHCRSCARTHAITQMATAQFVLIVDGHDMQPPYASPEAAMRPAIKAYDRGGRIIRLRSPTTTLYIFSADGRGAFAWITQRAAKRSD